MVEPGILSLLRTMPQPKFLKDKNPKRNEAAGKEIGKGESRIKGLFHECRNFYWQFHRKRGIVKRRGEDVNYSYYSGVRDKLNSNNLVASQYF